MPNTLSHSSTVLTGWQTWNCILDFGLALPVYAFPLPHSSVFEQESYLHSYTALEVIQFVYNVSSAQQDGLHRASSFEDGLLNDLGNNKYIGTISD